MNLRTWESSTDVQECKPAQYVVLKVFSGIDDGFAHIRVRREVHDRVHPAQHWRQLGRIGYISHDQLEARGERRVSCGQVVVNDGFVAPALERMCGMTADVSRASDDQNRQLCLAFALFTQGLPRISVMDSPSRRNCTPSCLVSDPFWSPLLTEKNNCLLPF